MTINMNIKTWNIENLTGYHPVTTFFEDFSIADRFGDTAVKDTYKRSLREWEHDYRYLTELVMVLNWKLWEHYEAGNIHLASVYENLWAQAADHAENTLHGEELRYYYITTD